MAEEALNQTDIDIYRESEFKQLQDEATADKSYLDPAFGLRASVPTSVVL